MWFTRPWGQLKAVLAGRGGDGVRDREKSKLFPVPSLALYMDEQHVEGLSQMLSPLNILAKSWWRPGKATREWRRVHSAKHCRCSTAQNSGLWGHLCDRMGQKALIISPNQNLPHLTSFLTLLTQKIIFLGLIRNLSDSVMLYLHEKYLLD